MRVRFRHSIVSWIYILGTLLIMAFISYNGAASQISMVVPFLQGETIVIHCLFAVVVVVLFLIACIFSKSSIRIDTVTVCLVIKCVLDLIPVFNGSVVLTHYAQHYATTLISLVGYLIISNTQFGGEELDKIKKLLIAFALVICCQVIYTAIISRITPQQISYKRLMVIPYGASNLIAAVLIPIICMTYWSYSRTWKRNVLLAVLVVSVLLTYSDGGVLLLAICCCFAIFQAMRSRKNKSVAIAFGFFGIVLICFYVFTNDSLLNYFANGRFETWSAGIDLIKETNLLFGMGMQPKNALYVQAGLHNILLDLILRCGLVGTLNYIVLFVSLMKKGKWVYDRFKSPFFLMVCVIYLNSLYEACYFTYKSDVFLWIYAGLMMSQYNNASKESGC